MPKPFRIFSGHDKRQAEAADVFAYSVQSRATTDFAINFASAEKLGLSRQGVTQFSYARFLVPFCCGYEGVAVFFDGCDQLCLGDVAELAAIDMSQHSVRVVKHAHGGEKRPRIWSSVMLLNCTKLDRWTPDFVETADDAQLMRFRDLPDEQIGDLPPEWNVLCAPGTEPPEGTKLAHYTALADPSIGSWIDKSGSALWAEWRDRWRSTQTGGER